MIQGGCFPPVPSEAQNFILMSSVQITPLPVLLWWLLCSFVWTSLFFLFNPWTFKSNDDVIFFFAGSQLPNSFIVDSHWPLSLCRFLSLPILKEDGKIKKNRILDVNLKSLFPPMNFTFNIWKKLLNEMTFVVLWINNRSDLLIYTWGCRQ